MPSYLDLALIAIVLVSAILAALRGFTREILTIASWVIAAASAYYLHPSLLPYLKPYIQKEHVALIVSIAMIFIVTLILVSFLTVRISDAILDSSIGAVDRSLGFLFGLIRGYLLAVIAFISFIWLVPEKSYPAWVQNSKMKGWLLQSGQMMKDFFPQDWEGELSKILRKGAEIGSDLSSGVSPSIVPSPVTRTETPTSMPLSAPSKPSTITDKDREKLDSLLSGSAMPPRSPSPAR